MSLEQVVGEVPPVALAITPFVGGLVASTVVGLRGRPGATSASAAFGLGLLAAVLLSKQSFANYFLLVEMAVFTAAIAWPIDGPYARSLVEEQRAGQSSEVR